MWREHYAYLLELVGPLQVPAGGQRRGVINIDRDSDFAVYRYALAATSPDLAATLTDQADRLFWDGEQHGVLIAGTGQWQVEAEAARVVKRQNQLRFTIRDLSGAPNDVRILVIGAQLYPGPPYEVPTFRWGEPWVQGVRFGPSLGDDRPAVPGNGSVEFATRLPGDAWFEVHHLAIGVTGPATVQVLTNGVREWWRLPVHTTLLGASTFTATFGGVAGRPSGAWPFTISPPKLLPPNTVLVVRVNDLSGSDNTVRLAFRGIRRYV
jgi:hypothetical protein